MTASSACTVILGRWSLVMSLVGWLFACLVVSLCWLVPLLACWLVGLLGWRACVCVFACWRGSLVAWWLVGLLVVVTATAVVMAVAVAVVVAVCVGWWFLAVGCWLLMWL